MPKSFENDLESALDDWIHEVVEKVQIDFQIDAQTPLRDVALIPEGEGFTFSFILPPREEANIPMQEVTVWVPATTYITRDKSGRRVRRRQKGYKRKQKVELPSHTQVGVSKKDRTGEFSSAVSRDRIAQLVMSYMEDDLPDFLVRYFNSRGWDAERVR